MEVILYAKAKVNWHLAVGKKRSDGYHNISSIFQTCSLCDELLVSIKEGEYKVTVLGLETLCEKGKSTIDKAANLWHEKKNFNLSLTVQVKKNIPSQAGMGGGSSDAASLLLYLNSIDKEPLSISELAELGSKVGCDVPFFIYQNRASYVSGLGEIVEPINSVKDLKGFVIIPKKMKVSTKEAYEKLDLRKNILPLEEKKYLVEMYNKPIAEWNFRNDFVIVNSIPDIKLLENEKLFLTGSGCCWVLITDRKKLPNSDQYDSISVTF